MGNVEGVLPVDLKGLLTGTLLGVTLLALVMEALTANRAQHRVHHSIKRREHNQNFGAVLSVWDRLFGTLTNGEPEHLGIEGCAGQGFLQLVHFGFTPDKPFRKPRRLIPRVPLLEVSR